MTTELEDPTDPEAMYLEVGTAVPVARPIMFGDVFRDVSCIRGGAPSPFVMVVTHPCSMRSGTELKQTVVTASLGDPGYPGRKAAKWRRGWFDQMPIFDLSGGAEIMAVDFGALHASDTAQLSLDNRVLALSNYGIAVTLQRWIYQLSRDPVPLGDLDGYIAPPLAEVEIQEEWCQVALDTAPADSEVADVLKVAGERVQEILGRPGSGGLRDGLLESSSRADVRRKVKAIRMAELGR
ncbi:hypothetical protein [Nocardioides sp. CER19]|uniref:hypothetical protein n=1 Tax=Nocardioides sp. CER19 TaxID=3038538 RepID=UPI00244B5FB0|nr:hypothetical protein [Nocardioides sp. CER19]MDH2414339.1 hypothetical protein [Nocardioides sp. CER19]